MDFNLVNIAITVRTDDTFRLSRSLPLLGNEFADICRQHTCRWPERVCSSCSRQETCSWHLIFGQKLSSDPSELKRHQKPPLPFMFSFPAQAASADRPFEMECGLVVVGQAISQLNLLLEGFKELLAGKSCPVPAKIIRIRSRDYQGSPQPFMNRSAAEHTENLVVLSSNGLMEGHTWGHSTLHIRLLSALRLVGHGHILGCFDFSSFARSLLRRVSSLAYYYGACESDINFKELSVQADAVVCTDNHFLVATGHSRKMSGIIGQGSFSGDFSGLMPFLVVGLYVHAGKGASFGMGMYEVLCESKDGHG